MCVRQRHQKTCAALRRFAEYLLCFFSQKTTQLVSVRVRVLAECVVPWVARMLASDGTRLDE